VINLADLKRLKTWGVSAALGQTSMSSYLRVSSTPGKNHQWGYIKIFPARKTAKQCFFGGQCVEQLIVNEEKLYRDAEAIVEVRIK
jgi:hypothetical protein